MRNRFAVAALALTSILSSVYAKAQDYECSTTKHEQIISDPQNLDSIAHYLAEGCTISAKDGSCKKFSEAQWKESLSKHKDQIVRVRYEPEKGRVLIGGPKGDSVINVPSDALSGLVNVINGYHCNLL